MSYFETQAGYNFTNYTIPRLTEAIENMTKELKRYNDSNERNGEKRNIVPNEVTDTNNNFDQMLAEHFKEKSEKTLIPPDMKDDILTYVLKAVLQ